MRSIGLSRLRLLGLVVLALAAILVVAGCGGGEQLPAPARPNPANQPKPAKKPVAKAKKKKAKKPNPKVKKPTPRSKAPAS